MTEAQLAELADLEVSWLSRSRTLIVQCLWGPTPVELFWWKNLGVDGLDAELRAAYRQLCANPNQSDLAAAREAVAAVVPRASQRVIDARADALRHHVRFLRGVVNHRPQIAAYRGAFPYLTIDDISAILDLPSGRGLSVMRLALLGVLDEGAT